ncbi:MAG TPA: hypothetical protein VK053_03585 [Jiangellaceae bacterium]|nr:hypothetical protein [Jiangellaceae bacterium]
MADQIPDEARDAIHAELDADTAEYREKVPDGEWTKPNRGASPLLTLRIPSETLEALQELAAANGVPVSTLARGFIADGLATHQGDDLRTVLERVERDLATVKARALAS